MKYPTLVFILVLGFLLVVTVTDAAKNKKPTCKKRIFRPKNNNKNNNKNHRRCSKPNQECIYIQEKESCPTWDYDRQSCVTTKHRIEQSCRCLPTKNEDNEVEDNQKPYEWSCPDYKTDEEKDVCAVCQEPPKCPDDIIFTTVASGCNVARDTECAHDTQSCPTWDKKTKRCMTESITLPCTCSKEGEWNCMVLTCVPCVPPKEPKLKKCPRSIWRQHKKKKKKKKKKNPKPIKCNSSGGDKECLYKTKSCEYWDATTKTCQRDKTKHFCTCDEILGIWNCPDNVPNKKQQICPQPSPCQDKDDDDDDNNNAVCQPNASCSNVDDKCFWKTIGCETWNVDTQTCITDPIIELPCYCSEEKKWQCPILDCFWPSPCFPEPNVCQPNASCSNLNDECFYKTTGCDKWDPDTKTCITEMIELPCICSEKGWECPLLRCSPCAIPEPVVCEPYGACSTLEDDKCSWKTTGCATWDPDAKACVSDTMELPCVCTEKGWDCPVLNVCPPCVPEPEPSVCEPYGSCSKLDDDCSWKTTGCETWDPDTKTCVADELQLPCVCTEKGWDCPVFNVCLPCIPDPEPSVCQPYGACSNLKEECSWKTTGCDRWDADTRTCVTETIELPCVCTEKGWDCPILDCPWPSPCFPETCPKDVVLSSSSCTQPGLTCEVERMGCATLDMESNQCISKPTSDICICINNVDSSLEWMCPDQDECRPCQPYPECPEDVFSGWMSCGVDATEELLLPEDEDDVCYYKTESCPVWDPTTNACVTKPIQLPCECDGESWSCMVHSCEPCVPPVEEEQCPKEAVFGNVPTSCTKEGQECFYKAKGCPKLDPENNKCIVEPFESSCTCSDTLEWECPTASCEPCEPELPQKCPEDAMSFPPTSCETPDKVCSYGTLSCDVLDRDTNTCVPQTRDLSCVCSEESMKWSCIMPAPCAPCTPDEEPEPSRLCPDNVSSSECNSPKDSKCYFEARTGCEVLNPDIHMCVPETFPLTCFCDPNVSSNWICPEMDEMMTPDACKVCEPEKKKCPDNILSLRNPSCLIPNEICYYESPCETLDDKTGACVANTNENDLACFCSKDSMEWSCLTPKCPPCEPNNIPD